jgi:6-phosphogluconolactonase
LLLVSNRGHDSLARFAIDLDTGHLEPQGYTPTDPWPRAFAISADGRFVYVAGRDACRVCCHRLEANSNQTLEESYPVGMCTMWIEPRLIN